MVNNLTNEKQNQANNSLSPKTIENKIWRRYIALEIHVVA